MDIKNRKGARIIFKTFWVADKPHTSTLAESNLNARGIKKDGVEYYEGEPHHKAHLGFTRKKKAGTELTLRPTPAGFWMPDPQRFIDSYSDTMIVYEGPMNQPSAKRIFDKTNPELGDIGLTNVGLGHRELMAFIRWLDEVHGKKTRNLFYAVDFDPAGLEAFERNKLRFERSFPGLTVLPIHDLLPDDIRAILPPLDISAFEQGHFWEGIKFDLNDLINVQGPTCTVDTWESRYIRDYVASLIRPKYAYIPGR